MGLTIFGIKLTYDRNTGRYFRYMGVYGDLEASE
jgi:hypothetical protein